MEAIPDVNDPERYTEASFSDSPFVEITSNEMFEVSMQYPVLGMDYAEEHCLVRREVYDRLVEAVGYLPEGYRLKIWDAWRPFALQDELYVKYSREIVSFFHLEECTEEERNAFILKFVSKPVADRLVPPVHTTGGAVDVTLVNAKGEEPEMGTGFDAFTDMTDTAHFEHEENERIRDNRRLLYHAMIKAGFTNLPSEWWHYDYGDRFWGFYKKQPARYRGVFTREEMNGKQAKEKKAEIKPKGY